MALIPYANEDTVSESIRDFFVRSPIKLNIFRVIANSEALLRPFIRLANTLVSRCKLDGKLREIAVLRTAKLTRSTYEWTQHVPIARDAGVTQEQIDSIEKWQDAKCFSKLERLVLRFTDEITLDVKGGRDTLESLSKELSPAEIVELIISIGFWGMVARLLETVEVDLEDFAGKINVPASVLKPGPQN